MIYLFVVTLIILLCAVAYIFKLKKDNKYLLNAKSKFHDVLIHKVKECDELKTELKTLKKQLQESTEDKAKQVHGRVFQARIYEKATPDVYQAVFEYTPNGQRVLQDLVNRFCGSAYTSDQNGGERETCRKLGQAEVISHINRQIYMANNPEAFKQYGVDDE